jgi:hypothetical protein
MTFNERLGEKGKWLQMLVNKWNLQPIVPFIRTLINVMKEMFRMSPLSPVIGEWREDFKAGGIRKDRAIAEMVLGTGIAGVGMSMAFSGTLTGQGAPQPGEKNVARAAGWQPYSIKVGDTYYSLQRIQPLGTLLGMCADVAEVSQHMTDEEMDKVSKMVAVAFANAVTNQTFLAGITGVLNVMSDPDRYGKRFFQNYAASLVPATGLMGNIAEAMDTSQREVYSVLDAVKARVPGLRQTLEPKRDVFGEEMGAPERLGGVLPVVKKVEATDKARTEAARLQVSVVPAPLSVHLVAGSGKLGKVELTPQERDAYANIGGNIAHEIINDMVQSAGWDEVPDRIQKRMIEKAFKQAHRIAAMQALPEGKREDLIANITDKLEEELSGAE